MNVCLARVPDRDDAVVAILALLGVTATEHPAGALEVMDLPSSSE
jgi:hypothetical protein